MESITNDDVRRIYKELANFYTAYRSYIYFTALQSNTKPQTHSSEFWQFQKYLLQFSMIINWCEVFGPSTKNNHWKEITLENYGYTKLLYEHGNYTYTDWYNYRKYIEEIKKSYLKHLDIYHHENPDIDLSGIDASLKITHVWLNKLVTNTKEELMHEIYDRWPICNIELDRELEEELLNNI